MAVYKRGYQRYAGPLTGRWARFLVLPRYAWRRLYQQRLVLLLTMLAFVWPVLCAGFMMIILDSTIVNVALPSIQADLGFSQSTLAWVVNGYLIAFGGLLLLSGRLGDLIGRRRVFLIGVAVF